MTSVTLFLKKKRQRVQLIIERCFEPENGSTFKIVQNSEVTGCADDTHSLQLSMNRPVVPAGMVPMSGSPQATDTMTSTPLFSAQLKFDDHIRLLIKLTRFQIAFFGKRSVG